MRFPLFKAVPAAFAAALACAATAQAVNLKGRVLDKATMLGVPGATVKVSGSSLTATTDNDGKFTLSGTVSLAAGSQAAREPRFKDGALFLEAAAAGDARIELFGPKGESLSWSTHPVKPGMNRVDAFRGAPRDFSGFARIRVDGHTWIKRAMRTSGPAPAAWIGGSEGAPASLAKSSAAAGGNVDVSVTGLLPKTVAYSSDDQDLGDIVMEYPARKIGVGAAPIYGATVLFDGSKGRAAANAQLQANWQDWPRFTPSDIKFRIVRDPQHLNDTNHVALQSCCNTLWGYDDIQAKIGLYEDCQIHVEWIGMGEYDNPYDTIAPNANVSDPAASGQKGYINSGVYVASRYEIQIQSWDTASAKIPGAHDMGAIVNDYTPTSNQNKGNGVWQSYDITYRGARYSGTAMTTQPYMSVWWNGVLVHDNRKVNAAASGLSNHSGEEHADPVVYGLKLQSEGRDVRYRNVWIKKLVLNDTQTKLGY